MTMKLPEYERELAEAKARLEEIDTKMKELGQEQAELTHVVRGWEAIVARARKQAGKDESAQTEILPPEPTENLEAIDLLGSDSSEEESENKTQFVRDQIQANAKIGMSPQDLKRAADAAHMEYPPSWPYGPLQRLKKKGEIVKRKGRFYPAPSAGGQIALVS